MLKLPAVLLFGGLLLAAPAHADPSGPLFERTLMIEADRRCGLFTPDIRAALTSSRLQARSAAMRARLDAGAVERRARARAASTPCRSADLQTAAARVRSAHLGWARLLRMDFPGEAGGWKADRTPSDHLRWRLVQSTPAAAFGLAGSTTAGATPYAVSQLPKKARPAMARLVVGRRTFLAETRGAAQEPMMIPGRGRSWAFRFPSAASAELAALPPNGTATLEVLGADQSQGVLLRMPIEVGDFAAGRAFLGQGV